MAAKTATVLFTDLVGSTEILSRLGEETSEQLRLLHLEILHDSITETRGREVKNLGDGVMAVFDSVTAALECGVAMQQALDRHNRWAQEQLSLRVGVSCGEVDVYGDGDLGGVPVVEAARLCAMAKGGQILTTDVVRRMSGARRGYAFNAVGPRSLKGFPEPVDVFELLWRPLLRVHGSTGVSFPPALEKRDSSPFVGRASECDALFSAWDGVASGGCRLVLIGGEPGIGKSRLAREFCTEVYDQGAAVLFGRCDESLAAPFQPFSEALGSYFRDLDNTTRLSVLSLEDGVLGALGSSDWPATRAPADGGTDEWRLFEALTSWLAMIASDQPVVLFIDDLQWASKPTLLALTHLVRCGRAERLLILGTYRDTEVSDQPLESTLAILRREAVTDWLRLSGLSTDAVAELISGKAPVVEARSAAFAAAIHRQTRGNPFFVDELVRHFAERTVDDDSPLEEMVCVPESLRDVVRERLTYLGDDSLRLLQVAAIAGEEFYATLVAAAAGVTIVEAIDTFDALVGRGILTETSEPARLAFRHAILRQVVEGDMTALRRAQVHREVALALEPLVQTDDRMLPQLAHHFLASVVLGESERAAEYGLMAARDAMERAAYGQAAELYTETLNIIGEDVDVGVELGIAQRMSGDPTFRDTLLSVAETASRTANKDVLVRAALELNRGWFSSAGTPDLDRVNVCEQALAMLGADEMALRARLLANVLVEARLDGVDRRRKISDEARKIVRDLDDPSSAVDVAIAHCFALGCDLEVLAEAAALAQDASMRPVDDSRRMHALLVQHMSAITFGNVSMAAAFLDEIAQLLRAHPFAFGAWVHAMLSVQHAHAAGRLDDAERCLERFAQLGALSRQPDTDPILLSMTLRLRIDQGRAAEPLALVRALIAEWDDRPGASLARAFLASMLCSTEEFDEAAAVLGAEQAHAPAVPELAFNWTEYFAIFADVAADVVNEDAAGPLYDRLLPYENTWINGVVWIGGAAARPLGRLATLLERWDDAERHLIAAHASHERNSAPLLLARTLVDEAELAVCRGGRSNLQRARELVGDALAMARERDAFGVERYAQRLGIAP